MNQFIERYGPIATASFTMLAFCFILFLMVYGQTVIIPIILAFFIWFIITYISRQIRRWDFANQYVGRRVSNWLSLTVLILFIVWIGRMLILTSTDVVARFEEFRENIEILLGQVPPVVWEALSTEEQTITGDIELLFDLFTTYFSTYVSNVVTNLTNLAVQASLVIIYLIFLLIEENTFSVKIQHMFPDNDRLQTIQEVLRSINDKVQRYISVKTFVSILTGLISYFIMAFFGIAYANVWATLIFLLNYIPYIGSIIAVIFPVIMCMLQFADWSLFFLIGVLLTSVQIAVGYFIEPLMMGNTLNISGVVVLFSLAVFGTIWGITGMVLAVPLVIILIIVLSHFESTRPIAVLLSGDGHVYGITDSLDHNQATDPHETSETP